MAARDTVADNIDESREWWTAFNLEEFMEDLQDSGFKGHMIMNQNISLCFRHSIQTPL